ncbi:MAG: DUF58 domain-containing protein [Lachnospiraceae bacterium]|nr:DUF58 domain-containing protein [Lachnospiraceae bacterium]
MIQTIVIAVIMIIALFLQRKYYIDHWLDSLEIRLKFMQAEIPEYNKGSLQIVVENQKKLPLPMLNVKFQTDKHLEFEKSRGSVVTDLFYHNDVFQVNGGERVTRTLFFYGQKRGYYQIRNVDLTSSDLIMSCEMHSSFQPTESVYILPKALESREFQLMLQQLNGEMLTKRNLYEDPFELRGIREYQPFDNMKSINWKATAKTGHFMVNQRNYTAPKTVRIFLNLEDHHLIRNLDELEDAIRLAAGLAKYLLEQGIKVSFFCNGPDIMTGEPMYRSVASGPNQQSAILRGLARVSTEKEALNFDKLFRRRILTEQENSYTCFVSATYDESFLTLLREFSMQGRVYSWFHPKSKRFVLDEIPVMIRPSVKPISMI